MISSRQEWLEYRRGGLGASDFPSVMGVSKWKTAHQLWVEKTSDGPVEEKKGWILDRGNEAEGKVRALFELLQCKSYAPVLVVMEKFHFMRSSLDGRSLDKQELVEFKMSGLKDWEAGVVPKHYFPQVQGQLLVSGASVNYFVMALYEKGKTVFTVDDLKIIPVYPDPEYHALLLEECIKFWDCVVRRVPPPVTQSDYKRLSGVTEEVKVWKSLDAQIKELSELRETARQRIITAANETGHQYLVCSGVRLTQRSRIGAVSYKDIPHLQNVNLEPYRKPPVTYWEFEEVKDEK